MHLTREDCRNDSCCQLCLESCLIFKSLIALLGKAFYYCRFCSLSAQKKKGINLECKKSGGGDVLMCDTRVCHSKCFAEIQTDLLFDSLYSVCNTAEWI